MKFFLIPFSVLLFSVSMSAAPVVVREFGSLPDGRLTHLFTLRGSKGLEIQISDYGATVVSLSAPDREGRFANIVLGFSTPKEYALHSPYFGAIVGRVGNRIAGGRFSLNGKSYTLATNNAPGGIPCSLHGGIKGFDKVIWTATPLELGEESALQLSYTSKDGEEGYPGNLRVTVVYRTTPQNGLAIDYMAETDSPTPVNLTNHSYFNLGGEGNGDILSHQLTLSASRYTPVDAGLIPTGTIAPVAGTPFDFTTPHAIGERVNDPNEQLRFGGGYDHNFVLDRKGPGMEIAASLYEPASGRVLEVFTTEPGLQFYCGNFLDGTLKGTSGKTYVYRGAVVLETQHFPDSINQPQFPTIVLVPGQVFHSSTEFRLSTRPAPASPERQLSGAGASLK